MSEETQSPVGADATDSSGQTSDKPNEDKVAYETFQKVLREKKSTQSRMQELEEKLKDYEQEKLQSKGKFEELVTNLKSENEQLKKTVSERDRAYVMSKVEAAIKTAALGEGCKQPEKLLRLLDNDDIENLTVDDSYNVDQKEIEMLITKAKQENDFLFKRARVHVEDGSPVDRPYSKPPKKLSEMTRDEILAEYEKLHS